MRSHLQRRFHSQGDSAGKQTWKVIKNNDHLAGKPIETRQSKQCEFCIYLLDKSFDKSGLTVSCGCKIGTCYSCDGQTSQNIMKVDNYFAKAEF